MTADLRRFEYALEPLRRQRQWTLEALQAELGRAQRVLSEAEDAAAALRARLRDETARVQELAPRLDPARHRQAITWLVQVREAIEVAVARVSELRAERDRVRAECLSMQQKLEVIDRHREECVAEFQQQEESRLASDADREWLVRRQWAGAAEEGDR